MFNKIQVGVHILFNRTGKKIQQRINCDIRLRTTVLKRLAQLIIEILDNIRCQYFIEETIANSLFLNFIPKITIIIKMQPMKLYEQMN